MEIITLLLVDHKSKLVREGLTVLLHKDKRFKVVSETNSVMTAGVAAWAKKPAVIILVNISEKSFATLKPVEGVIQVSLCLDEKGSLPETFAISQTQEHTAIELSWKSNLRRISYDQRCCIQKIILFYLIFALMQVDYLLIGQGICGSFLSYELEKAGKSFIVIDEADSSSASRVASGVINPVTGRRIVKTWMIDKLLPFAWKIYKELGAKLDSTLIEKSRIIDFFPTAQMKLAFDNRYQEDQQYLARPTNENDWKDFVNYDLGYGIIEPAYRIDIFNLLMAQRQYLKNNNKLLEEWFDVNQLRINDNTIHYNNITASSLIFCDGAFGFDNPYFKNLPYGANKGEALLLEIKDMPANAILKKGYSLVPYTDTIFWLGSTYLWEYENPYPTPGFYDFAKNWLKQTIKLPFTITHHMAGIRPATLERRPFVGFHPVHKNIGVLNGMGTKGCSLAPFFAKQLTDHIVYGTPILPEADVRRFTKILSR